MERTTYNADHHAFRTAVRSFLSREVSPYVEDWIEQRALPRSLWLAAGRNGLLGMDIPVEHGGAGNTDYRFNAVLAEELAHVTMGLSSCVGIHTEVVTPYLVELTTEEQKQRWLPAMCTGELLTAIGMTEPSGGSDLAALRTTALRDGDGWVLNGSKTFITNGYSADLVLVAARTSTDPAARDITLFAVEADMPGFSRSRKLAKIGQHESDTAELFFQDIRIPDHNRVGEVGAGFAAMMERLPQERLSAAVANIAHAGQILDETLEYVRERHAFGRPVGEFQHNKFSLAELVTTIEVSRAYLDQAVVAHTERRLSAADAAKVKWWSAQVQNDVLDQCVQLHGGYGFMSEYRVARAWSDARVTKIWAGSNEIMKELIGRDLGLGRSN